MKLYMIMLGCTPKGRNTEQHDIFFGIGNALKDLIPSIKAFWPEANGVIHIDAWREVSAVDDFNIKIEPKNINTTKDDQLFFINLGGYKPNEFEEYHYKVLSVAKSLSEASKVAKKTSFYKHCGYKGATSHIDDKYGIDVDQIYNVKDILTENLKELFDIIITKSATKLVEDCYHIGYLKLEKIV